MYIFSDIFLHSWKKYVVSACLSFIGAVVLVLLRGYNNIVSYCDAAFVVGFVFVSVGIISLLSSAGAFDTFGYSINALARKKEQAKQYDDLYDYVEKKKEKRKGNKYNSVPYFVVGIFWIIISLVLFIFI